MTRPAARPRRGSVDDARPESANYHANALVRGLALLESLAHGPQPQTLSDFGRGTGLPKSTLVRLLAVLGDLEYVVRVDDRPAYRLGHKVLALSSAYLSSLDVSVAADPLLARLSESTGQTANVGVLDGDQVVHIGLHEPDRPIRFTATLGARDHSYCTGLGKLLLSQLPPNRVADHVPPDPFPVYTDHTIGTLNALQRELRRSARRGYALDDGERSLGLSCVSVPILTADGEFLAALSLSGPTGEFTRDRQEDYLEQLREAAEALAADQDVVAALRMVNRSMRTSTERE